MSQGQDVRQSERFGRARLALLTVAMSVIGASADRAHSEADTGTMAGDASTLWRQVAVFERADEFVRRAGPEPAVRPEKGAVFAVDRAALTRLLARPPREEARPVKESGAIITLPCPDGTFQRFAFVESPILSPRIAAQVPEIRTFLGQGIDDPAATLRFDITPLGFHAQVLAPDRGAAQGRRSFLVEPVARGDTGNYVSYTATDTVATGHWECATANADVAVDDPAQVADAPAGATVTRHVLGLAIAGTGEFTANASSPDPPNTLLAFATAVSTINRVNQILENDLAVRLLIVSGPTEMYTNGATDPYSGTQANMQSQNQANLDSVIGSSNYDIGHLFHYQASGYSGNAGGIGTICSASKGMGISASSALSGDIFTIDLVAHEIGHQLGANHTFNGINGSCGAVGQYTAATAYEPGSGTTIMSYGGTCGSDNIPASTGTSGAKYPMFNFSSINQIAAKLAGGCGTTEPTPNHVPVVQPFSTSSWIVPTSTPFRLLGSWGDEDFGDFEGMTGSWEQADLGPALALGPDTGQNEPLFGVFMHGGSGERFFPRLSDVLTNTTTAGETLPLFLRSASKYKFVVRDNVAGGGGTAMGEVTIQFAAAGTGFDVSQPAGGEVYCGGSSTLVIWNVAGTADPPVSCADLDITMSYNGGQTFPLTVRAATPNVGFSLVTLPALATEHARIMVSAVDNIFFAVNPAEFAVVTSPPTVASQTSSVSVCPGQTFQMVIAPGGGEHRSYQWYKNTVLLPGETVRILGRFSASHSDTGDYTCVVSNVCGQVTSAAIRVQVGVSFDAQPAAQNLTPCQNAVFSVAARGVGSLSYQWRKEGVLLANDGRISGANSASLQIAGARYEDEGVYDCLVTDSCETLASATAALQITTIPTWQLRSFPLAPTKRGTTAMAYDANRGVSVLYGGYGGVGGYANDTWEYEGFEWTLRTPPHNPGKRSNHAMCYDSDLQRIYLWGGWGGELPPISGPLGDLWAYDGNDWTLINSDLTGYDSPYPTTTPELAYDSYRKKVVLVRNLPTTTQNSETWEYDPAANQWTKTVADNGFPAGYGGAIGYDPVRNQVVHYWGNSGLFGPTKQTWRYNGTSWTQDAMTTPQLPFTNMAYDSTRQRLVLFGANYGSTAYYTNSYYDSGTDWPVLLPPNPPDSPPNFTSLPTVMVFDVRRRAMVALLWPYYAAGDAPFETWEYRYLDRVVIDRHPHAEPLNSGSTVNFIVHAVGYGTLAYQWKRNGANLSDGPSPGGATIAGTNTASLTLAGVQPADGGIYACEVSNACGSANSNGALLGTSVAPDFDRDGDVDDADFVQLAACFTGPQIPGPPISGCTGDQFDAADDDADNDVDQDDFGVYQRCYSGAGVLADPGCAD